MERGVHPMGLDWKVAGIEDYIETCWIDGGSPRRQLQPVTEALIWLTVSVEVSDTGTITPEVLPEFYARVYAWERGRGVSVRVPNEATGGLDDRWINWADVVKHCGLYTNVFPAIGRRAFVTKLIKSMREGWMSTPDTRPVKDIRADIEGWMTEALEDARRGMRSALAQ
jgi:hypothetical protein